MLSVDTVTRVFFSGAGGVGKTAVVGPMVAKLDALNVKSRFMPSVSREFFASQGITTEQAGLERPEKDRLDFQLALFEFYCKTVETTCQETLDDGATQVLILDRSPFDHIAFCIYNAPNLMTYELLQKMFERGREVMMRPYKTLNTSQNWKMVRFPPITSWLIADDKVAKDGMRYAPPGKNFIVDAIIDNSIRQGLTGVRSLAEYILRVPDLSPETRARFILEHI